MTKGKSMESEQVQDRKFWRWGVNRWLVLLFIVLGVFAARAYPPIQPHVQLPAEELTRTLFTLPVLGGFKLTNTLVALFLADGLLLLLAISVARAIRRGDLVLRGVAGAVEGIVEALYTLTESTAGKWARSIFPWMATIVLLVLVVNWMELIPGVDSIGLIHHSEDGHPVQELGQVGNLPVVALVKGDAEADAEHAQDLFTVVPFVRVASTDLNFTVALALTSVVMTQIFGVRALGASYFTKFFYTKTLFSKPIFGAIDFGVGLLELVSEFSKILSFAFRLFGNIFAGSVLLFVIGSLVPVFAQSIFLLLEFFIGLIQALVFGMLTLVFMSQATAGHGDEGH
jgi:F-type H+-transporting ATPase subunit a